MSEERTDSAIDAFGSERGYAKYTRVLSVTAEFSQDIEYVANLNDANSYRLRMETDLIVALSNAKHISLKASYRWKRINQPVPGFGKDDTTTSLALIVKY